jgi:hypothetical protein
LRTIGKTAHDFDITTDLSAGMALLWLPLGLLGFAWFWFGAERLVIKILNSLVPFLMVTASLRELFVVIPAYIRLESALRADPQLEPPRQVRRRPG